MNRRLTLAVWLLLAFVATVCPVGAQIAPPSPAAGVVGQGVEAVFDTINTTAVDPKAQIRYMPDNMTSWYARWAIMDNAKKSIDTTYFIFEQDVFGYSMMGLLLKKAREGINIRIMMDARGTKGLTRKLQGQDVMQELAKFPNVHIKTYNAVHSRLFEAFDDLRKIMASNHDKIICVDGQYLITGGRNISKNYFVDPSDLATVYRDTDILINSPVVAAEAKLAFDEEFGSGSACNFSIGNEWFGNIDDMHRTLDIAYHSMRRYMMGMGVNKIDPSKFSKETVKLVESYTNELLTYKKLTGFSSFRLFDGQHSYPTRILDKNSLAGFRNDITNNLFALMDACKSEIIIQNPYVVLTPGAEAALQRASDRGVRIIIQTNSPMSSDSLLTQALFVGDWKNILKKMPKVEIYAYKLTTKLHSKTFVFDRKIAVIGTYNMDYVSEQINSEMVAVVKGPAFAEQVARRIGEDMKNSFRYEIKVKADGTVETVFGPESHSDPKVLSRLNLLLKLQWLRPII
ncbi:MAG: phosphatidylserine/phosphatidylglycerophosphate/cardiolipin synthase family protein [Candidatus Ozemobacteraceae bacterium]